jgi:hypothetical protein
MGVRVSENTVLVHGSYELWVSRLVRTLSLYTVPISYGCHGY